MACFYLSCFKKPKNQKKTKNRPDFSKNDIEKHKHITNTHIKKPKNQRTKKPKNTKKHKKQKTGQISQKTTT